MTDILQNESLKRLRAAQEQILNSPLLSATTDAEVFATYEEESRLVFENDDFSVAATSAQSRFGTRVIREDRTGFATTNSLDSQSLEESLEQSLQIARVAPPSPFDGIAQKNDAGEHFFPPPGEGSFEVDLASPALLLEIMQWVLKEARADSRIAIDRIEVSGTFSISSAANTNGVRLARGKRLASWVIMGMARDGSEVTSFDYDGGSCASLNELRQDIERRMAGFRESVLGSLKAKKARSYRGPVLFHPYAVLDLLATAVTANAKSRAHLDGISPWKDRLGDEVAHRAFVISEAPLDAKRAMGYRLFDREGNLCGNHTIIDEGRLVFLAENCHTSKRSGRPVTGNATGDARTLPDHGFSNLTIDLQREKGADVLSLEDLFRRLGTGLLLKRFSGNDDPTSGQFSGVAKNSRWIEGGEVRHAVVEAMISGDLFSLLKQILAGSDSSLQSHNGWTAPWLLIDGVNVVFD